MTKFPSMDHEREEPEEIIEDLESIKDLLLEAEHTSMLSETVSEPPNVTGTHRRLAVSTDPQAQSPVFASESLNSLLSDTWRDSVDELFESTRARIEANSTAWLPEQTDELADALKIRIDATVRAWLAATLEANINGLRERMVSELSAEIHDYMQDKLRPTEQDTPKDHG